MYKDKKIVVVLPAYNAANTLRQTYDEIVAQEIVDHIILVDDNSTDETAKVAETLEGVQVCRHDRNKGYGGNQKTCYDLALKAGADIIIMVHPDYQYTPYLIPAMASIIGNGLYDMVLGSRILGGYMLEGGMPLWKYIANRFLTFFQNICTGAKLSEYHTGYRAYSRTLLEEINYKVGSDDFIYDNQIISKALWNEYKIAEITCPTKYFAEASSINLKRSIIYGLGCMKISLRFLLAKRLKFPLPTYLKKA